MRPGGGGDGTFDHGMGVRVRVVRCALGPRLLEYDQSLAHLGHCRRSAPAGSCDRKKEVGESVPFGRMGTAEDLCGIAIFVATDEAGYIISQTYNVDGGQWMS